MRKSGCWCIAWGVESGSPELLARARSAGEVTERFTDDGVRITGRLPESLAGEIAAVAAQPTQRQRPRPARTA